MRVTKILDYIFFIEVVVFFITNLVLAYSLRNLDRGRRNFYVYMGECFSATVVSKDYDAPVRSVIFKSRVISFTLFACIFVSQIAPIIWLNMR